MGLQNASSDQCISISNISHAYHFSTAIVSSISNINLRRLYSQQIGSQITDNSRKGVGFVSYNVVPPPHIGLFSPPTLDLPNFSLEEFQKPEFEGYGPKTSKSVSEDIANKVRESADASLVEELMSDDKSQTPREIREIGIIKSSLQFTSKGKGWYLGIITRVKTQKQINAMFDSGSSRHMTTTCPISQTSRDFDGGYVTLREELKEENYCKEHS
ncbi:hypothetical protein Tco_0774284 [Tanacetum coccineum]|uniref:Uncharacterized protein n=1 Tax=Tanacetum coccineum TaxID=301880 RepID=A0ABQ4ZN28_9ASTR